MKLSTILAFALLAATLLGAVPGKPRYLLVDGKPCVTVAAPGSGKTKSGITVEPADGAVVPLLTDRHKEFIAMESAKRVKFFEDNRKLIGTYGENCNQVKLSWTPEAGNCVVTVSEKPDMKPSISVACKGNGIKLGNLKIATKYYWKVSWDDGESKIFSFTTEDVAPRILRISGTGNVRDLGGRKGLYGRRIRQGLIYRSAAFNETSSNGRPGKLRLTPEWREYVVRDLGIVTDLDLRNEKETAGMESGPLGDGVAWMFLPSSQYSYILKRDFGRAAFLRTFRMLQDEKNYPVDFHCIHGKDRTGTLAFILNALLGVDENELVVDWEATRFGNPHGLLPHKYLDPFIAGLREFRPGGTIRECAEAWALDVGVTKEEIENFRRIMLE
ncbi:MAG: tyrosine-protein phosphatase [Victivallaceae bacterium]|nr:tyrosine-protein phosphatase [Victivallaceae bacterium]